MIHAIFDRRSIRKYKKNDIPPKTIAKILESAILAPSSKNRQPWKFVVVSGSTKDTMLQSMQKGLQKEQTNNSILPESKTLLAGAFHTLKIMEQAPVTIFIVNSLGKNLFDPLNTEDRIYEICNMQSIGAAIQNMTLAATELGLGSLWICDIFFAYKELSDWLNVDGELVAAMAVGYADEQPAARPRKPLSEIVEWRS